MLLSAIEAIDRVFMHKESVTIVEASMMADISIKEAERVISLFVQDGHIGQTEDSGSGTIYSRKGRKWTGRSS